MYILFDIGGTNMRVASSKSLEDTSQVSEVTKLPTPQSFDQAVEAIISAAQNLSAGEQIEGICGGVPAPISRDGGSLINPAHLPDWDGKPLAERLSQTLGSKTYLANDTALIGLGEAIYGAGKDHEIVAFIGIGTGIGGARITNGKIDSNRWGFEPGHHIINLDGEIRHWEGLASGSAINQKYGMNASDTTDPEIWNQINSAIAIGLYNTTLFWSPDVIVVGGGLGSADDIDLNAISTKLGEINAEFERVENVPNLLKANLGDRGGIYGSLAHLKNFV